ncbi:MAG: hypothetical protein J6S85_20455 [Methanobrevibacter sp.]|nr:hypothetical protein [Methanobrevibacter sp.]
MMGAAIKDIATLLQAGINPKTGLPVKMGECGEALKENIKRTLRIMDEQDAVRRYRWYNLPEGLDGELLERILYYRGQGMFFYVEELDKFYFLPFTLASSEGTGIDLYGRFIAVKPVPFMGSTTTEDKKAKGLRVLTDTWVKKVIMTLPNEVTEEMFLNGAVLLHDYCKQISQTNIPRQTLQDPILDVMSEIFPYARTSLIANSGVRGIRVGSPDEEVNVKLAGSTMKHSALIGDPYIALTGGLEFQELTGQAPLKSEEFLIILQAMDNFRLSLYGLKNGGLFQKKSHMLEAEQEMNDGSNSLVYDDGLYQRQKFCDMVNAVWDLGIWCEASAEAMGMSDPMLFDDEEEQQQPQEQEEEGGSDE